LGRRARAACAPGRRRDGGRRSRRRHDGAWSRRARARRRRPDQALVRTAIALALAVAILGGCEVDRTIVVNNPTPSRTPSASPSVATASPPPTPTPTPVPTPLVSSRGSIVVKQPLANSRVHSPLTIAGDASVFESNISWQVTDTAGRVL